MMAFLVLLQVTAYARELNVCYSGGLKEWSDGQCLTGVSIPSILEAQNDQWEIYFYGTSDVTLELDRFVGIPVNGNIRSTTPAVRFYQGTEFTAAIHLLPPTKGVAPFLWIEGTLSVSFAEGISIGTTAGRLLGFSGPLTVSGNVVVEEGFEGPLGTLKCTTLMVNADRVQFTSVDVTNVDASKSGECTFGTLVLENSGSAAFNDVTIGTLSKPLPGTDRRITVARKFTCSGSEIGVGFTIDVSGTAQFTTAQSVYGTLLVKGGQLQSRTLRVDSTGSVTVDAGDLTMSSYSLTVEGSVTVRSGNLAAGPVSITAGSVLVENGDFTSSSFTLSGSAIVSVPAGNLYVSNALSVSAGTLSVSGLAWVGSYATLSGGSVNLGGLVINGAQATGQWQDTYTSAFGYIETFNSISLSCTELASLVVTGDLNATAAVFVRFDGGGTLKVEGVLGPTSSGSTGVRVYLSSQAGSVQLSNVDCWSGVFASTKSIAITTALRANIVRISDNLVVGTLALSGSLNNIFRYNLATLSASLLNLTFLGASTAAGFKNQINLATQIESNVPRHLTISGGFLWFSEVALLGSVVASLRIIEQSVYVQGFQVMATLPVLTIENGAAAKFSYVSWNGLPRLAGAGSVDFGTLQLVSPLELDFGGLGVVVGELKGSNDAQFAISASSVQVYKAVEAGLGIAINCTSEQGSFSLAQNYDVVISGALTVYKDWTTGVAPATGPTPRPRSNLALTNGANIHGGRVTLGPVFVLQGATASFDNVTLANTFDVYGGGSISVGGGEVSVQEFDGARRVTFTGGIWQRAGTWSVASIEFADSVDFTGSVSASESITIGDLCNISGTLTAGGASSLTGFLTFGSGSILRSGSLNAGLGVTIGSGAVLRGGINTVFNPSDIGSVNHVVFEAGSAIFPPVEGSPLTVRGGSITINDSVACTANLAAVYNITIGSSSNISGVVTAGSTSALRGFITLGSGSILLSGSLNAGLGVTIASGAEIRGGINTYTSGFLSPSSASWVLFEAGSRSSGWNTVYGGQITVRDESVITGSLIATSGDIDIGDHVNVSALVITGPNSGSVYSWRTIRFGNFSRLLGGSLNAETVIVGDSAELSGGINTQVWPLASSLLVFGAGVRTLDGTQRASTLMIGDGVDIASTVSANESTRFIIDHHYTVSGGTVSSADIEVEPGVQVGGELSATSIYLGAGSRLNKTVEVTNLYGPALNESSAYIEDITTSDSVTLHGNLTLSIETGVRFTSETVTLANNTLISGGVLGLGGSLVIDGANITVANFTILDGSFRVLPASENNTVAGPTTLRYLPSGLTEIGGKLQLYWWSSSPYITASNLKWLFDGLAITGVELRLSSAELNYSGASSIERLYVDSSVEFGSSGGSLSIGRLSYTGTNALIDVTSIPSSVSTSLLYVVPYLVSPEGYGRLIVNGDGRPSQQFYHEYSARRYGLVEQYLAEKLKLSVGRWGYLLESSFHVGGAGDLLVRLTGESTVYIEGSGNVTVHWIVAPNGERLTSAFLLPTTILTQVDDISSASAIPVPDPPAALVADDNTVRDLSISILVLMIVLTVVVLVFIILCSKRGGDADA